MATSIATWPTEVLFAFFSSLDPLEFASFAQVCKKWSQMSVDNELWRRFCERRWDVLPKEKDFAKNWLIPMREGGVAKERRIDWKRVYLMRDLGEKAEEALSSFLPAKKSSRAPKWMKDLRKKKTANNEPRSLFAQGWLSVKDLEALQHQVRKSLDKMVAGVIDGKTYENIDQNLLYIANFHMQLELHIVSQVTISRLKYATYGSEFIAEYNDSLAAYCRDKLPWLVANFSQKFCETARQKDVPIDTLAKHLMSCTELFAEWHPSADFEDPAYVEPLSQFIQVQVTCLHDNLLGDAWNQFLSEPSIDDVHPTGEIEESLNYMSMSLKRYPKAFELFMSALQTLPPSTRRDVATVSVIHSIVEGCAKTIVEDLSSFMDKYFLPYLRMSDSLDLVVASLLYLAHVPSFLSHKLGTSVPEQYASRIVPTLLSMLESSHTVVQLEACSFLSYFCETADHEAVFEPHLQTLFDKLYDLTRRDHEALRKFAISAVTALLSISDGVFVQYGEAAVKEFRKLLTLGDKNTRDFMMQIFGQLGAILSVENKSRIATDIAELYSQAVEEFKADRELNEEALIKLTEFAVNSLGKDFAPFLPIVLPILFEKAAAQTSTLLFNGQPMDTSDDEDEDPDEDSNPVKVTQHTFTSALEAKISAVAALGNILGHLDTETLQPYLDQIRQYLEAILEDGGSYSEELITTAAESYANFLTKHCLVTAEAVKSAELIRALNIFNLIFGTIFEQHFTSSHKENIVKALNLLVDHIFAVVPDLEFQNDVIVQKLVSLLTALYEHFQERHESFDEQRDLGSDIVDYAANIFSKIQNKKLFLAGFGTVLSQMVNSASYAEPTPEDDWVLLCIISAYFDAFGKEITATSGLEQVARSDKKNRGLFAQKTLLEFFDQHLDNESPMVQQVLAYHYGSEAEKMPELFPTGEMFDRVVAWIEEQLTMLNRAANGGVYDNALMAYMNIIYYHHAKLSNIHEKMVQLSTCFPPALQGDWDEVTNAFNKLKLLFEEKPEWFTAEVKKELKQGLEETIADAEDDEKKRALGPQIQLFIEKLN